MKIKVILFALFILFFFTLSVSLSIENEILSDDGEIIRETIPDNADYGSAESVAYLIAQDRAFENYLFQNGGPVIGYGNKDGVFVIQISSSYADTLTDRDFETIENVVQTYAENGGGGPPSIFVLSPERWAIFSLLNLFIRL
ncbi:MAG: hypothetical protein LBU81_04905 [Methanosarcinales archaeon]|jgi:hypothetical protein|nr:hypothetical protein [Methanosarcinales archaeon]